MSAAPYDPVAAESISETLRGLATLLELDPANAPRVRVLVCFPDNTFDSFGNMGNETYQRIVWTEINTLLAQAGVHHTEVQIETTSD